MRGLERGKQFLARLAREDSGQGTVEYILLLSITVGGVATLTRGILKAIDNSILGLGGQLERDLKTGRASLSAWKN